MKKSRWARLVCSIFGHRPIPAVGRMWRKAGIKLICRRCNMVWMDPGKAKKIGIKT